MTARSSVACEVRFGGPRRVWEPRPARCLESRSTDDRLEGHAMGVRVAVGKAEALERALGQIERIIPPPSPVERAIRERMKSWHEANPGPPLGHHASGTRESRNAVRRRERWNDRMRKHRREIKQGIDREIVSAMKKMGRAARRPPCLNLVRTRSRPRRRRRVLRVTRRSRSPGRQPEPPSRRPGAVA